MAAVAGIRAAARTMRSCGLCVVIIPTFQGRKLRPREAVTLDRSHSRPGAMGIWCQPWQCPLGKSKAAGRVGGAKASPAETDHTLPQAPPGGAADLASDPNVPQLQSRALPSLTNPPTHTHSPRNNLTKSPGRKTPSKWDTGHFLGCFYPLPISSISNLLPIRR